MQLIDEQDHVAGLTISFMTTFSRSSNCPRYFVPATRDPRSKAITRRFKRYRGRPSRRFVGPTLRRSRFAHPGFADQGRVVFGTAAQNLQNPFDFISAADDGIQHGILRQLRQVPAEFIECGGAAFLVPLPCSRFPQEGHGQLTRREQIAAQAAKHFPARSLPLPATSQQEMLAPDVIVSREAAPLRHRIQSPS